MTDTRLPDGLRYGPEHEWTLLDEHGIAVVGITDFAQDQLGDVQYVDLPEVGTSVTRGAPLLEIESTKTVSEVFAPVGGVVVAVNDALVEEPAHLNTDPHATWICRIRPSDPAELDDLMSAEAYRSRLDG